MPMVLSVFCLKAAAASRPCNSGRLLQSADAANKLDVSTFEAHARLA